MASQNESVSSGSKSAGVHCIAPGCSNYFYNKKKDIHYHRLPLKNPVLLRQWIQKLKRSAPPVNAYARVCSEHFLESDYVYKGSFTVSGSFISTKTSKLHDGAVPSVFDFSGYNTGTTDCPSQSQSKEKETQGRSERYRNRTQQKEADSTATSLRDTIASNDTDVSPAVSPLHAEECITQEYPVCKKCAVEKCTVATQTDTLPSGDTQIGENRKTFTNFGMVTEDIACRVGLVNDHCYTRPVKQVLGELVSSPEKDACDPPTPGPSDRIKPVLCSTPKAYCGSDMSFDKCMLMSEDDDSPLDAGGKANSDSDYVMSSVEGGDSSDVDSDGSDGDDDSILPPSEDMKYVCFQRELLALFKICHTGCCGKPVIQGPNFSVTGYALKVHTECIDGHTFVWHSQPKCKGVYAGNLLIPAALFVTGNSFSAFDEVCETLNMCSLSTRQSSNMQKAFVIPEVESMWDKHIESIMSAVSEEPIVVSGDARCDSPGHNATYGTYTFLDVNTDLIVAQETVKVTEVKNSYWLEPEGMERCLTRLSDHNVTVETVATDRHPTISKVLREEYDDIDHELDLWHIVKGIKKKALNSKNAELVPWVRAIANHMWYSVATCNGDPELLKEKWLSILHHITNQHEWVAGEKFTKCDHAPYTAEESAQRPWLKTTSKGFQVLKKIVADKRLLKDLGQVTKGIHTGQLESIHSLYTKYVPKRKKFSPAGIKARLHLAAIDHNDSVDRRQATTLVGDSRFKLQYSKAAGGYIVKQIKERKTWDYRQELVKGIMDRCEKSASLRSILRQHAASQPSLETNKTIGEHRGAAKPDKASAVALHISRFTKKTVSK